MFHLQVLGTLCTKLHDPQPLQKSGQSIVAALDVAYKAQSRQSAAKAFERLFQTGLRTLNIILVSSQTRHGLNMIDIVEVLRQCFTFSVDLEVASSLPATSALALGSASLQSAPANAGQGTVRYRPPHARRQSSSSSGMLQCSESQEIL